MKPIRIRSTPEDRSASVLLAAVHLSIAIGYKNISGGKVADAAKCSRALVLHHFGSVSFLRDRIMEWAVKNNNAELVLQGIVAKDPIALVAPDELKEKAKTTLNYE